MIKTSTSKTSTYLAFLFVIALAIAIYFDIKYIESVKKSNLLELNYKIADKELIYVKTKNDELAAQIDVQEFTIRALKHGTDKQLLKEIDNLNIKLNKLVNYSNSVIYYDKVVITTIKDSIVNDTIKIKTFQYKDEFYNINAIIYNDSIVKQHIYSQDSIIQAVYKGERINRYEKKMPNWWIFTPRRLQQRLVCKNPSATIKYQQFINVKKD